MSSHGNLQDNSENDGKKKSSDKKRKRRVLCHKCSQPCSGEVLKVQDRYFHIDCFYCKVCKNFLSSGGFYVRGEEYYCTTDYQNLYGTKCFVCQHYVEGEVVTALNNTYHKECFKCDRCKCTFSPGSTVTYDGHKYVCQMCLDLNRPDAAPDYDSGPGANSTTPSNNFEPRSPYDSHFVTPYETPSTRRHEEKKRVKCYKCHNYINDNTLLVAMEKFWHQWCFTCSAPACKRMIAGRFVARGEEIYCEPHYFERYGVRCTACNKYITGKVLMANDACYHFDCAKCAYCKRSFRHDQDLYKDSEGPRLWHQECGLTSRQEYLSRTQSEDLATSTEAGNKTNLPDLAQLSVQREESATPTPPTLPENVSSSQTSGLQSPSRAKHVRDYSQGSSDLSSQRSRVNSYTQSVTTPSLPQFQSTPANSALMRSFDTMVAPEQEVSATPSLNSTYNRRRVMSDTFNLRYSNHGSYDNFKKAHEFFTSRETSTEHLFPPRTGPSPKLHSRQLSDLSSTSSGADRRLSPVSMSPQRSPGITDSSTSTIKRTLKETHSHFEEIIDERQELEPQTDDPSLTSNSSSCLHSVASAPQLDQPSPDNRRPRSVEGVSRKQHKTISESRTHSQINRKMRPKSEFASKSMPEQPAVYPLQRLLVTAGEYQVFPRDVDRSRLEQHLSAEDFFLLFSMTKEEFSVLPPWKQGDMKRKAKLF